MKIEVRQQGSAVILKITGRMDAEAHREFAQACDHWIEQGATHLVVDVAALDYISSAGLGTFARASQALKKKNGAVILCGVKGLVKEVFEITRLLPLFPVFDSPQAACDSLLNRT